MNDLTDEQRARALEMDNVWAVARGGRRGEGLTLGTARAWLAVEAHVLASHTCPDPDDDSRVQAWDDVAKHPFFADCYQTEGSLVDAVLAKLDAAHTHTCEPVWRPVAADEIRAGWEVRSRHPDGREGRWGVAHRQDADGDWRTEAGNLLTYAAGGWTYETTAPLPEPEPWPDELVGVVGHALAGTEDPGPHWDRDALTADAAARAAETVAETTPTRRETPDVAELRRLAEACPKPGSDPHILGPWWDAGDLARIPVDVPADREFIMAASPAAVLALLDDADALRAELAHMTEARDNARAEVERLTALVAEVRATAEHYDGQAYANAAAVILRVLDGEQR